MVDCGGRERRTAIENAGSELWSVRAAAGRRLAASAPDRIDEVADVLHRLLLDPQDSAVTAETAEALLARGDTVGLRHVLLARSRAAEQWTADEIQAALDGAPGWTTARGANRMARQLRELATDSDEGVREEALRRLARLRPREA
ncbi:hypothetical protein OH807_02145 [Kitasatospora sp. NBC_01560]|uniref:hypothetical protein n=1 Tax=Kitasatospora sp. NBC_01560 TaxID=2975965 RepID=UPI0038686BB6